MRGWLAIGCALSLGCGRLAFEHGTSSDARGDGDTATDATTLPGILAYWKLDENMGTSVRDSAGGTDGVLMAGSTTNPTWSGGQRGSALTFGGDGDQVSFGTPPVFSNLPAVTVTAWVRPGSIATTAAAHVIVDKGQPSAGWAVGIADLSPGDLWFRAPCATTFAQRSSVGLLTVGRWSHVAASWDGRPASAGISLYVDGAPVATGFMQDCTEVRPDDSTIGLLLNNGGSAGLIGTIDEVQVYNRVLTPAEVAAVYNATK
jgi:hypothetical protein